MSFSFYFEAELTTDGRPGLKFTHKMFEGVTPAERYGIRLAEIMGYPDSILNVARKTADILLAERKVILNFLSKFLNFIFNPAGEPSLCFYSKIQNCKGNANDSASRKCNVG